MVADSMDGKLLGQRIAWKYNSNKVTLVSSLIYATLQHTQRVTVNQPAWLLSMAFLPSLDPQLSLSLILIPSTICLADNEINMALQILACSTLTLTIPKGLRPVTTVERRNVMVKTRVTEGRWQIVVSCRVTSQISSCSSD